MASGGRFAAGDEGPIVSRNLLHRLVVALLLGIAMAMAMVRAEHSDHGYGGHELTGHGRYLGVPPRQPPPPPPSQEALLAAAIKDERVTTYVLTQNVDLTTSLPMVSRPSFTVRGMCGKDGRRRCVINGMNKYRGFVANYSSHVALSLINLEFTGLRAVDDASGGAAAAVDGGRLTVKNCVFRSNKVGRGGAGGAVLVQDGSFDISGSAFEGNAAGDVGGAIFFGSDASGNVSATKFKSNSAMAGGAVYAKEGKVNFHAVDFSANRARARGGALFLTVTESVVSKTRFNSNSAGQSGGAVHVYLEFLNTTFCSDTSFNRNTAAKDKSSSKVSIAGPEGDKSRVFFCAAKVPSGVGYEGPDSRVATGCKGCKPTGR
ncbi:hypothetical protein CBR_g23520 [Chara braunii]|uniref:Right handed beta helix domain-containing protein n=1 Tax=Chara braunii TaxID=69332 RepID=A0A388L4R9_CHABU|nr:hypothetical protein CBR_g23520 [Chara braunii]|eukprot:GBG77193.1 hypothetical protein CBR_g23520 [Chara braunii]